MSHKEDKLYLQVQAREAVAVNTSSLQTRLWDFIGKYKEAKQETEQSQPQMLLKAVRNSGIWSLFPDNKVPAEEVKIKAQYLTRRTAFSEKITDEEARAYTYSQEGVSENFFYYRQSLARFQPPKGKGQKVFIHNICHYCRILSLQGNYEEDPKYNTSDSVADVLQIMEQLEVEIPLAEQLEFYAVSHLFRAAVAFNHQDSFAEEQINFKDNPFYHLQKASELVSVLEQVVEPTIWAQRAA